MAKSKKQITGKGKKNNVANPNTPKSKRSKILATVVTVVVLGIVGLFCFMIFGHSYKNNAFELKTNSILATRLAGIMLADYQESMIKVETEKSGMNAKGQTVSTSDPNEVLQWRVQAYKENGSMGVLDSLMNEIQQNYENMGLPPAKYRSQNIPLSNLYEKVKALSELAHQPGKSLVDMAKKSEELMDDIDNHIEESNTVDFMVDYNVINDIISQAEPQFKDKNIVEQMLKDHHAIKRTQADAIKYILDGFKQLPDGKGVLYKEIAKGSGPTAKENSEVKLHYEGKLMDGTVFDSSYEKGEPAVMMPFQTVPGFKNALVQMQKGSKWQIYIPYSEAYGERAQGLIEPKSNLEFTIEVISIN